LQTKGPKSFSPQTHKYNPFFKAVGHEYAYQFGAGT
jgi:hypothetical protein